jgi:hypothetical protein
MAASVNDELAIVNSKLETGKVKTSIAFKLITKDSDLITPL